MVVVPFAALLPVIAPALARVLFGYGAAAPDVENYVPSLALFGPGLVFFTVHYLMLRGFYALEQTRTVFVVQCACRGDQHPGRVAARERHRRPRHLPALVAAYAASYLVGSVVSSLAAPAPARRARVPRRLAGPTAAGC